MSVNVVLTNGTRYKVLELLLEIISEVSNIVLLKISSNVSAKTFLFSSSVKMDLVLTTRVRILYSEVDMCFHVMCGALKSPMMTKE